MLLELANCQYKKHMAFGEAEGQINLRDIQRLLSIYSVLREENGHETSLAAAMHLCFVSQAQDPSKVPMFA